MGIDQLRWMIRSKLQKKKEDAHCILFLQILELVNNPLLFIKSRCFSISRISNLSKYLEKRSLDSSGVSGFERPRSSQGERGGSIPAPRKASDKLRKIRVFKIFHWSSKRGCSLHPLFWIKDFHSNRFQSSAIRRCGMLSLLIHPQLLFRCINAGEVLEQT